MAAILACLFAYSQFLMSNILISQLCVKTSLVWFDQSQDVCEIILPNRLSLSLCHSAISSNAFRQQGQLYWDCVDKMFPLIFVKNRELDHFSSMKPSKPYKKIRVEWALLKELRSKRSCFLAAWSQEPGTELHSENM
jgi:hypothetical protein